MHRLRLFALWTAVAIACAVPTRAHAFKFASALTDGCHEAMVVDAVARAGWPDGASPTALSGDERLIARDLPFDMPRSKADGWILAMTIGVRFNDLHGLEATDLPGLANVHNDPNTQSEHCLRSPTDDGLAGDLSALAACREFILERIDAALVDAQSIDLDARTQANVALAFQGKTAVSIQRYGFEVGRALHALQDSFSHTFRSPDGMRVRHVLNFVDLRRDDAFSPARDGHPHLEGMDLCDETDPRQHRRELAVVASAELLAALNGGLTHAERRAAAAAVVTRWLDHEPGCTIDNNWCDASERNEPVPGCGVATSAHPSAGWPLVLWMAALLCLMKRRAGAARITLLMSVAATLLAASATHAQSTPTAVGTPPSQRRSAESPWGVATLAAGAIDDGALAARVGSRLRVGDDTELGFDAEYNPWFSLETQRIVPGSFNAFGTFIYEWFEAERVTVRTSAHLGVSVLLFDLVGAPRGSWGPLVGLNLIGVSIAVAPHWKLLVEPAEVMLPIVRLSPIPYYYRQYRFAFGIQFNP